MSTLLAILVSWQLLARGLRELRAQLPALLKACSPRILAAAGQRFKGVKGPAAGPIESLQSSYFGSCWQVLALLKTA